MPDVAAASKSAVSTTAMATTTTDKYLFVVGFMEGKNFPRRARTKFLIEAKFDGELLASDPVEHTETFDISQELAWEIDKKQLQLHKLQRSCIKCNCYAVSSETGTREHIGYIVLDVRSTTEAKVAKELPLLQCKYQKQKPTPTITCMVYTELISSGNKTTTDTINDSLGPVRVVLDEEKGFYKIESTGGGSKNSNNTSNNRLTVKLTLALVFARNLLKLVASGGAQSTTLPNVDSQFFFVYKIMNNQVTTKPFGDLVSSHINAETTSIQLRTSLVDLIAFLKQLASLEILFCSDSKILAKTYLDWTCLLEPLKDASKSLPSPIIVDQVLKLELSDPSKSSADSQSKVSGIDTNVDPVIGVQCSLERVNDDNGGGGGSGCGVGGDERASPMLPLSSSSSSSLVDTAAAAAQHAPPPQQVIYQNDSTTITVAAEQHQSSSSAKVTQPNETVVNVRTGGGGGGGGGSAGVKSQAELLALITEEMQLKAAYELQVWKEQREREFEAHLKKLEAKKFQALAEAFKQHDVERETILQKKVKEYNDLELLLKNSLSEVEKREKKLTFEETQIARLKADLHRDYETKLIELREASKRVQEKADHQMNLQKSKLDSMDEEIGKYKRQVIEWEKRYADKELEFARYKERESSRPEIKLQAEINMLRLEKVELERKLEAQTKAKQHYKEQFLKTLEELTLLKRRDEANARALLKKQQMELDHLRMKYLGGSDSGVTVASSSGSDEIVNKKYDIQQQVVNTTNNIESTRTTMTPPPSQTQTQTFRLSDYNLDAVEPHVRQRLNRLVDERECLMRTGAYTTSDDLIVQLDACIRECLRDARLIRPH